MDVVVEGKITPNDAMDEVVKTVSHLKLAHGVLRITCEETGLQGRIGFGHEGYILGGKVNASNETGWEAVRQLLSVRIGNYAILDEGQMTSCELNQTLWIKADNLIPLLASLPDTPKELQEADASILKTRVEKPGGQIDLWVPVEKQVASEKATVSDLASKARQHDQAKWKFFMTFLITTAILVLVAILVRYGKWLWKFMPH